MKQFFISILVITASILTAGASTLIEQADSAYMADDFAMAASLYNKVIAEEGTSATLYYNLGNCYYRLGQPGKAIVAYERSLRLDPTSADTRDNLDFVNERIIDRSGERGTFIGNAIDAASNKAKSDTWAYCKRSGTVCILIECAIAQNRVLRQYSHPYRHRHFHLFRIPLCGIISCRRCRSHYCPVNDPVNGSAHPS